MHNKKITHKDLKPENILLESTDGSNLEIKISDFGFSCFFDPQVCLGFKHGSTYYMAPEIILDEKCNEKVDIWSIGVISYMLLSGQNLFLGNSRQIVKNQIVNSEINFNQPIFE